MSHNAIRVLDPSVLAPQRSVQGSVSKHQDHLVLLPESPRAQGRTAVVYLSGGGSLMFSGRGVEAREGRLVRSARYDQYPQVSLTSWDGVFGFGVERTWCDGAPMAVGTEPTATAIHLTPPAG